MIGIPPKPISEISKSVPASLMVFIFGSLVKNPGPKDLLWFAPWKGSLNDAALLNILMECWSDGVLEKRKPNTDLL
jgi:hypothetical protein